MKTNELSKADRRVTVYLSDGNATSPEFRYMRENGQFSDLVNRLLSEYQATGSTGTNQTIIELNEEIRRLNSVIENLLALQESTLKAALFSANYLHEFKKDPSHANRAIDLASDDYMSQVIDGELSENYMRKYSAEVVERVPERIPEPAPRIVQPTIQPTEKPMNIFPQQTVNPERNVFQKNSAVRANNDEQNSQQVIHASLADILKLGNKQ